MRQGLIRRATALVERFADHSWYPWLLAFLSAADAYVFFVPIEALLIPAALVRPRHWVRVSVWVSLGSAIGAAVFAWMTTRWGVPWLERWFPGMVDSRAWIDSTAWIERNGMLGLGLVSLSPLPQHAAVAVAGIARMPALDVFIAVAIGRLPKYLLVAWLSVRGSDWITWLKPDFKTREDHEEDAAR